MQAPGCLSLHNRLIARNYCDTYLSEISCLIKAACNIISSMIKSQIREWSPGFHVFGCFHFFGDSSLHSAPPLAWVSRKKVADFRDVTRQETRWSFASLFRLIETTTSATKRSLSTIKVRAMKIEMVHFRPSDRSTPGTQWANKHAWRKSTRTDSRRDL